MRIQHAGETFRKEDEIPVKVQLFVSCLADMVRPEAAIAAVHVLEKRGVGVEFPEGQTCCGQFSYNAGYQHEAAVMARHFVRVFESGTQEDPTDILALSGSCAATVMHTYPGLLYEDALQQGEPETKAREWKKRAEAVAGRVHEWSMWLGEHADQPMAANGSPLPVAYHLGCHMRRLLPESRKAQDLLRALGIDAREPENAEECCGFGGTYSFTEPVVSTALADDKLANVQNLVQDAGAVCLTGADLGCLLHLEGRLRRQESSLPVCHVAELVELADQNRLTPDQVRQLEQGGGK